MHPPNRSSIFGCADAQQASEGGGGSKVRILQQIGIMNPQHSSVVHVTANVIERTPNASRWRLDDPLGNVEQRLQDERCQGLARNEQSVGSAVPAPIFGLLTPEKRSRPSER